jgi:hypothetical protein
MPASQKIITKLRERRQIEADLRGMLAAESEFEFRRQAQQIAALGSQVIPAIVGNLDRADARLLTAMGTVAMFLDRREVIQALREAVIQPQRSDQGRLGAMTIMERFLGEPPDDDLLSSLADPEEAAVASLDEVLDKAGSNPAALVDYVQNMDRQEPDVVLAVVDSLRAVSASATEQQPRRGRAVELLRMLAQDVRGEISAEALDALGSIRRSEAARALQSLIPVIATELQPMAVRSLRKLRFRGVQVPALAEAKPDWRALVSSVDGLGQQSVWFILDDGEAGIRFLNILLTDRVGAVEAMGHERVSAVALPPRRSPGFVHDVALPDGSGAMLVLEATFDVGRRLVLEALPRNRETQIPVAGVLRLLSTWLWSVAGADALPPRQLPDLRGEDRSLLAVSDRLLVHPTFASWTARGEATLLAAEELVRHPARDREVWVRRLAGDLFGDPVVAQVLSRRLKAMSEWLLLAGEETWSRTALVSARAVLKEAPQGHPFLLAMVRRDLELAIQNLRHQAKPVFE